MRVAAVGSSAGFAGARDAVGIGPGLGTGPPMRIVLFPGAIAGGLGDTADPSRSVCAPGEAAVGGRDGIRTAETRSESSNAAQNSPAPGQRSFGDSASAR